MNPNDMFVYEYYQRQEKARKRNRAAFEKIVMDNKLRAKAEEEANSKENLCT
jgi:hypothetical protein